MTPTFSPPPPLLYTISQVLYLAFFSSLATVFPFLNVVFRRAGLSEQQIGLISLLKPAAQLPAGSIWSGIADKYRIHRSILITTFIISSISRSAIGFLASTNNDDDGKHTTTSNNNAHLFLAALSLVLLTEGFGAPVTIITDSVISAACNNNNHNHNCKKGEKEGYARQRLYGAVGWGITSPIAGYVLQTTGSKSLFIWHAIMCILTLIPTYFLPMGPLHARLDEAHLHVDTPQSNNSSSGFNTAVGDIVTHTTDKGDVFVVDHQHHSKQNAIFWANLDALLHNKDILIFLSRAIVLGYGVGHIENFLFLALENQGASETLMGLTLTFTCIAETAVFYYTDAFIAWLGNSITRCLHLVYFAFILRMGCYSLLPFLPSLWFILPVELLHGLTFALAWAAGTTHCSTIAPPGLEATTQSLYQGFYFGVGYGMGGLVGGLVYQYVGAEAVFVEACIVMTVGWTVCWTVDGKYGTIANTNGTINNRGARYSVVMPNDNDNDNEEGGTYGAVLHMTGDDDEKSRYETELTITTTSSRIIN